MPEARSRVRAARVRHRWSVTLRELAVREDGQAAHAGLKQASVCQDSVVCLRETGIRHRTPTVLAEEPRQVRRAILLITAKIVDA